MARVEQSTRIDVKVSVERVWDVLGEVERRPEWTPTVTSEYVGTELEPGRSFT